MTTSFSLPNFTNALSSYSKIFHSNVFSNDADYAENEISSPLGSWLLLATLAASTDFSIRKEAKDKIESLLGIPIEEASVYVEHLLELSGVETASAAWFKEEYVTGKTPVPGVQKWLKNDTLAVKDDHIPSQEWLNNWVSTLTHGLITEFPIEINSDVFFIVANVIYTKFSWESPFQTVSAHASQMNGWGVENVLADESPDVRFFTTPEQELLMVHSKESKDGQKVLSVTSPSQLAPQTLLNYATEIVHGITQLSEVTVQYAESHSEGLIESNKFTGPNDAIYVNLPAWEASSEHDLNLPELLYNDVAETLAVGMKEDFDIAVKQTAVAKFTAEGFEAAAVTAFAMMRASAMRPMFRSTLRTVNFSKKYAVVCFIGEIPVFTAIVRKGTEAKKIQA